MVDESRICVMAASFQASYALSLPPGRIGFQKLAATVAAIVAATFLARVCGYVAFMPHKSKAKSPLRMNMLSNRPDMKIFTESGGS
jgi:hypothetical protein